VSDNLATRIGANQQKLGAELKPHYDFIVCGSGSSGSVVARRLAENADVNVLLLEAGGSDDVASIKDASAWPSRAAGGPGLEARVRKAFDQGFQARSDVELRLAEYSRGHRSMGSSRRTKPS
jgi:choline dehydrogenase-like flavoprotein